MTAGRWLAMCVEDGGHRPPLQGQNAEASADASLWRDGPAWQAGSRFCACTDPGNRTNGALHSLAENEIDCAPPGYFALGDCHRPRGFGGKFAAVPARLARSSQAVAH